MKKILTYIWFILLANCSFCKAAENTYISSNQSTFQKRTLEDSEGAPPKKRRRLDKGCIQSCKQKKPSPKLFFEYSTELTRQKALDQLADLESDFPKSEYANIYSDIENLINTSELGAENELIFIIKTQCNELIASISPYTYPRLKYNNECYEKFNLFLRNPDELIDSNFDPNIVYDERGSQFINDIVETTLLIHLIDDFIAAYHAKDLFNATHVKKLIQYKRTDINLTPKGQMETPLGRVLHTLTLDFQQKGKEKNEEFCKELVEVTNLLLKRGALCSQETWGNLKKMATLRDDLHDHKESKFEIIPNNTSLVRPIFTLLTFTTNAIILAYTQSN